VAVLFRRADVYFVAQMGVKGETMTDLVTIDKASAPANPFARNGVDFSTVAAGNVAIESERAIAEAQGALLLAKRFPRDQHKAYAQIMESCKRRQFAETASYAFPRGGQTVSGPSIRLAEELARCYGNIDYGIRELSQQSGFSEMEAYAWDLETNTRSTQRFTVQHKSLNKTKTELTDPRDIYERTANDGARRLRSRILSILPADLVEAAEAECKKTMSGGNGEPVADRARKMITAFSKLGISVDALQSRIGHSLDTALPEEFAELQQIFLSVRDGMTRAGDWFSSAGQTPAVVTQRLESNKPAAKADAKPAPKATEKKAPEPPKQAEQTEDETLDI